MPRSRTTTCPSARSSRAVDTGEVLARRHNERELTHDPTAHAEVLALRDAAQAVGSWRLRDCVLVVTLEPCPMCAGAAVNARVPVVAFGADDLKAGALGTLYNLGSDPRLNHAIDVRDGVRADEAAALLEEFFAARRADLPDDLARRRGPTTPAESFAGAIRGESGARPSVQ